MTEHAQRQTAGLVEAGLTLASEIDQATVEEIGDLPRGQGVLGVLLERGQPMRMREISSHPDSYGFPSNHPPMHSFLGVPIVVRDRVFGHLYLTEKKGAPEFTKDDERIIMTLAAQAGVAIQNARWSHRGAPPPKNYSGRHRRGQESDVTNDEALMAIEQLAHEEHALREAEGHRSLSEDERKRLVWLEERLDQCWDLLRQRRALLDAGRDPDDASVRGVDTVEHYKQ